MNNQNITKEMLVHIALNTYDKPKNILILSQIQEIENELKEYNVNIFLNIDNIQNNSIDIALLDREDNIDKISSILKDDGLIAIVAKDIYNDIEYNSKLFKILAKEFKIVLPSIYKDNQSIIIASKKYHPSADIRLQQAEMIEKKEYYNADIHKSSFVYNNYIESLYKGLLLK